MNPNFKMDHPAREKRWHDRFWPLDARRVLDQKEKWIAEKFPAVILAHDYGASRQQMLPLVAPVHQAGFVVLVLQLRGSALGGQAGSTFGLKESGDVKAGVNLLRK